MRADPELARTMEAVGPYALEVNPISSLFVALSRSIVYQQLHGKAAATIFGRVKALGDDDAFPTPTQLLAIDDVTLRGAGLSQNKLLALRDLAKHCESGALPTLAEAAHLDDETLVEKLTAVRGIGRWSVEMLLIFNLGRRDVLPVRDLGIQKGFQFTYGLAELPKPADIAARGEKWAKNRTMAAWYLWRASDLAKR
jgi:3-methyladenine DNA glycosylase/8-oxoguanine DNA glycosylase